MKNVLLFVLLMFVFATFAQKAKIVMNGETIINLKPLLDSIKIVQLEDGCDVPTGYKLVARGRFKTGPATVKCGERLMIQKTKERARFIGAPFFSFCDVKEPNGVFNTCYRSKILFLIRE